MLEIHEIAQPVKEELLEIYQAFTDVCQKHGLRHWVAYGTMLGAVRHHGFIPWDDDFDVFMLREEYERFLAIADEALPPWFKPITYRNCKAYPATFAKIQETRRYIYNRVRETCGYVNPHGLYIDIFPLDGCPVGWFAKKLDVLRLGTLFCMDSHLFRAGGHSTLKGRVADLLGTLLTVFHPSLRTKNDFARQADRIYTHTPTNPPPSLRRGDYEAHFQRSELVMPRAAFDDTLTVPFEGSHVPIPKDYDACLKAMYGSGYMTPPPLEKRVSEHSRMETVPWIYGP